MLLYHGTSERVARLALTEGLAPRFESGVSSTWEEHPSSEHYVYLTTAYAGYFAMNATPDGERWAIIEIDTDLLPDDEIRDDNCLYPDEDFLEQATRGQMLPADWDISLMTADPATGTMAARTAWFRHNLWRFGHLWEDSIKGLGNCAHDGVIPPEAITRVSFVDPKGNPSMTLMASDPRITLMNYRILQAKYVNLLRWFMGDEVEPLAFLGAFGAAFGEGGLPPDLAKLYRKQAEDLSLILADRSGVELHPIP